MIWLRGRKNVFDHSKKCSILCLKMWHRIMGYVDDITKLEHVVHGMNINKFMRNLTVRHALLQSS